MSARYRTSTIAAILEDSEDESQVVLRPKDAETESQVARRHSRFWFDSNMAPKGGGREREKEKSRKHRSSTTKQHSKSKSKHTTNAKKGSGSGSGSGRDGYAEPQPQHRRRLSNRSTESTSSEEEDEARGNHQIVLAASRARLTSPSMVSQFTAATNKSSGSSGSNSTVTQASITNRTALVKRPEPGEAPLSPAVPDAPDVFAYLEAPSVVDMAIDSDSEESDGSEEGDEEHESHGRWSRNHSQATALVHQAHPLHKPQGKASSPSSASSSFHGEDDFSSPPADVDTDRSSSPERSVKGNDSGHENSAAMDPVSAKIASQMAAAQQRQNRYESSLNTQRIKTNLPHSPSSAMTPRYPPQEQRPLSPGDWPVTGYELLASRLSSRSPDSEDGRIIKPMYRKFEALNHRVLLHLQDELSELEDHLQRLDRADTESRRTERQIIPASRRAAEQAGGELNWHKTDVLGRIGYKLTQYNQALSSFNKTQSLNAPDLDDISAYRTYLQTETPIAEVETHFLDPTSDLVSVYSDNANLRPPRSTQSPSYAPSSCSNDGRNSSPMSSSAASLVPEVQPNALQGLASAIAVSVLVPILTFGVIDKFLGRLVVTLLVAVGVLGALLQSGILSRSAMFGNEAMTCVGIYGSVMIIMAGII